MKRLLLLALPALLAGCQKPESNTPIATAAARPDVRISPRTGPSTCSRGKAYPKNHEESLPCGMNGSQNTRIGPP